MMNSSSEYALERLPQTPVQVLRSSIVETEAQVIVNSANNFLRHGSGVARAISDAFPGHQANCDRFICQTRKAQLPIGSAVMFSSDSLKDGESRQAVIHAVGMGYRRMNKNGGCSEMIPATLASVRKTVFTSLSLIQEHGFYSVAFPLMCSRKGGLTKQQSAYTMLTGVLDFEQVHPGFLGQIFFHCFEEADERALLRMLGRS